MAVRYLLDTHVFLWLTSRPGDVPEPVRRDLEDLTHQVLVSAASAMEIATKMRIGRMPPEYRALIDAWDERCAEMSVTQLPITGAHAVHAGSMEWAHRDPFDRLLVAQAVLENAVLVTVDAQIRELAGVRLRTW